MVSYLFYDARFLSLPKDRGLFYNAFLQIFGEVHLTDTFCGIVGCYLGHVVFYHELYKLLEGGGHWVPTEFSFRFGRVAPKVDYIGGAVEVFADSYDLITYFNLGVGIFVYGGYDASLVDAFAFPT